MFAISDVLLSLLNIQVFDIISLQPLKHPLAFLTLQVYWQWTISVLFYLKISLFHLYSVFSLVIEFLAKYLSQHLKNVVLLSSILHSFWWGTSYHFPLYVICHFILAAFKIFTLSLIFISLTLSGMVLFILLGVVELLASVNVCLPSNWGHFQSLFFYIFLPHSLSLLLLGLSLYVLSHRWLRHVSFFFEFSFLL